MRQETEISQRLNILKNVAIYPTSPPLAGCDPKSISSG